jgi:FkbM family methyltransferase
MMSVTSLLSRRIGNELYKTAFPLYRPLYSAFKACADRAERHLLARHLSAGCVVVDVGANIGIYSQFFSKWVGSSGAVHSFEPSPDNFARLRLAVKHLANVHANQLAVGDRTAQSLLYLSDDLNVDHRAYPTAGKSRRTVPIQAIALDDYFKPGARVDLIKMDIQGYELHALRGATRVLGDNPGIKLLIEFWPYGLRQAGASAEELLSLLSSLGFTAMRIDATGVRPLRPETLYHEDEASYLNLIAIRSS